MRRHLLILCFIPLLSFGQVNKEFKWNNKTYLIYPQRQDRNDQDDIIPVLNNIQDGEYIVFAEKTYKKSYSLKDTTDVTITFAIKKGKKEGPAIWYSKKGKILQEGYYENDMLEGEWKKYFKKGELSLVVNYSKGLVNGKKLSYRRDGTKDFEKNYLNGLLHGMYLSYYKNGATSVSANYKNGKKHGLYQEFYSDGKIELQSTYYEGDLIGVSEEYNFGGNVAQRIIIDTSVLEFGEDYSNFLGEYNFRTYSGQLSLILKRLKYIVERKDRDLSGRIEQYYPNGQLKLNGVIRYGRLSYIDTVFHENGKALGVLKVKPINDTAAINSVYEYDELSRLIKENHFLNKEKINSVTTKYSTTKKDLKANGDFLSDYYYSELYYRDFINPDTFVVYTKSINGKGTVYEFKKHLTTKMYMRELDSLFYKNGNLYSTAYSKYLENDSAMVLYTSYYDPSGSLKVTDKKIYTKTSRNNRGYNFPSEQKFFLNGEPISGRVEIVNVSNRKTNKPLGYKYKNGVHKIDVYSNKKQSFNNNSFDGKAYSKSSGEFLNGVKNGEWVFEDPFTKLRVGYLNDSLTGEVEKQMNTAFYYTKKRPRYHTLKEYETSIYENRKQMEKYGIVKKKIWFVREKGNYNQGQREGEQFVYHPNGLVKEFDKYENGMRNGLSYELSIDKDTVEYKEYKEDKYHGIVKEYNKDGSLKAVAEYINGDLNGKYKEYRSGLLYEEGKLINNIKVGDWNKYYSTGEILIKETYKEEDSVFMVRLLNYNMRKEHEFDRKNYGYKSFFKNGELMSEGEFIDDYEGGLWKYYNEAGNLIEELDLNKGKLILSNDTLYTSGKVTKWYNNGQKHYEGDIMYLQFKYDCHKLIDLPSMQVNYLSMWKENGEKTVDNRTGHIITYGETGLKNSEGDIVNGYKEGAWKYWDEEGRLSQVGKFVDGEKSGRWLSGDLEGIRFIDDCINPYADLSNLFKNNSIDNSKIIEIDIRYYLNGNLIKTERFKRNNNDPKKPYKRRYRRRRRHHFSGTPSF